MPRKAEKKDQIRKSKESPSEKEDWEDDNSEASDDEDCEEKYILYRILQVAIDASQEEIVT